MLACASIRMLWIDPNCFALVVSIQYYKKRAKAQPKHYWVFIELIYFFESEPCSSAQWLLIILWVCFCVPISLIKSLTVKYVVFILFMVWVISCEIMIIIWPVLLVQFSKPFLSEKCRSRIVSFFMAFILFQEIFVVFILPESFLHFLLTLIARLPFSLFTFLLPVIILVLVAKGLTCFSTWTENYSIVFPSKVWVT